MAVFETSLCMISSLPEKLLKYRFNPDGNFRVRDAMKIFTIIIFCFMMLMMGCSSLSKAGQERQMDENQRIYGDPYRQYWRRAE
jgi:hypothetical protein